MKKFLIVIFSLILVIFLGLFTYTNLVKTNIKTRNTDILINKEYIIDDFIEEVSKGIILNKDEKVMFDSLGENEVKIFYKEKYNNFISKIAFWKDIKEKEYVLKVNVKDNEIPEINGNEKITITVGDKVDLIKDVKVTDNSKEEIIPTVEGEYDLKKAGTYKLKYKAVDSSNNTAYKDFELIVKEKKIVTNTSNAKYYVKINKTLNVVMVYSQDDNKEFTNLVKTFVCSAGNDTPVGTFTTTDKAETLYLYGGVWGHYTVRIYKGIWFHSVPYFTKPSVDSDNNKHWDNLEYEEYNKLGTLASAGCIRLSTKDAKWIYDNLGWKTPVEIYESDTLPEGVTKPTAIKIDVNSENRGWDPTDPDPTNPWKK